MAAAIPDDYSDILTKPSGPGLGLLSAGENAGAGALESVLSGGNVFQGVESGLKQKAEYGDIFRKAGLPEPVAATLGFGASMLTDPLNLIPIPFAGRFLHGILEGAFKVGGGGKLFKAITTVAERAGERPESILKLAQDIPDLASARARVGEHAAKAAQMSFAETMGTSVRETAPALFEEAKQNAKKAAAEIRGSLPRDLAEGSDPLNFGAAYNAVLAKFGDNPVVHGASKLVAQANHAAAWYTRNLADNMRTNPHAWGERGPEMAAKLEYAQQLGAQHEGQSQTYITKLFGKLTDAEDTNISEVMSGEAKPINQKVADIVQGWRSMKDQTYEDLRQFGVKQKVPPTHSLGQTELFDEYAQQRRLLSSLTPKEDWIEAPIQYRGDGLYKIRSEKVMRALNTEGSPTRKEAIAKLREHFGAALGNDKQAAELLDNLVADSYDPLDIRGGPLQHTRDDILDILGVPWEKKASVWMRKYAHIASRRSAQAVVFGGEDQVWKQYAEKLAQEGGDLKLANDSWRAFIGRPSAEQNAGGKLYQFLRTIQTFRLGPRVGALQMLQLSNSAAMFGSANTGRALGALIRDPKLQQAAHVVGALLPSQHLAYDASELDNFSSWWIKLITQMPRGDRFARSVSALSAGHRLTEIGEQLANASGAKRRILERELYTLGIDAKQLAAQEYKPSLRQIQTAMQRGAKITQFTTDVTDLPAAARSNAFWRTMFIFRGFSKQQSTFMNRILREARKGNIKPALRYASAFTGMYNLVEPALQLLQGKEYDPARDGETEDYLKTMFYAGALGSFGDYLSTSGDTGKLLKGQVGPVIGTAADYATTGAQGVTSGDWSPMRDVLTRNLPGGLGTVLINQR